MRISRLAQYGALCALLLAPTGVYAKRSQTPVSGAGNDAQTASGDDAPTITFQGATYALLPDCFGTLFVVGINQTPVGQSDTILVAIPYPGGIASWPPITEAATGALADKSLNDAVCLQATG